MDANLSTIVIKLDKQQQHVTSTINNFVFCFHDTSTSIVMA